MFLQYTVLHLTACTVCATCNVAQTVHTEQMIPRIRLLLSNSQYLPIDLRYITQAKDFVYLLTVCQGPKELSMQCFPPSVFSVLIFNAGHRSIPDIYGHSFLYRIFLH
jgi:hypothetical protein